MRIGIIEDHQLVRDSFKKLLELQNGWQVIIEACSVTEAKLAVNLEQPNVFIVDISMHDGENGLAFLTYLNTHFPDIKTIVASMYDYEPYVSNALKLGAQGYVSKRSASEALIDAVNSVIKGGRYISEDVKFNTTSPASKLSFLTPREKEILALVCQELSTQEIADQLFISVHTVETHRRSLLSKTGCKNSVGLVRFAVEHHLL